MGQTLSIRLDDELLAALDHEARRTGMSRNRLIRDAVVLRLGRAPGLGPLREVVGLIQGPADLSTNRAYRRAWKRPRG